MVPFLDLSRVHEPLEAELTAAFQRVLLSSRFIMGPEVVAFEHEFADWVGVPHAIGVSSGTDALLAALMALEIGPGDSVLVPTLTFFATAGTVVRLGAEPIFCDVDPHTLLIDVDAALARRTPGTRIVIPVHLFGQCAPTAPFAAAGLTVVEDAAQSHGAENGAGVRCGGQATIACFSFFPTKPVGALGDAGIITTADTDLADAVRLVRTHGAQPKFHHEQIGGNFRLDALQAALLRVKLRHTDRWNAERQRLHARYRDLLAPVVESGDLRFVGRAPGTHVHHQHVVRVRRRDALQAALTTRGIGTAIYYPEPLHIQPCFEGAGGLALGSLPHAEAACSELLTIPCFAGLTDAEQDEVAQAVRGFYGA